jgi:hypothetical protein
MRVTSDAPTDPALRLSAALYRARLRVNRTPHFTPQTRREANRALDAIERQMGRNRVNLNDSVRAIELLIRAHPSIAFDLLRDEDFTERFAAALRQLGLRGIKQRLDEVTNSVMAEPIPGPARGRRHRDELPADERVDAEGNPLPPPPGYY